MGGWVDDPAQLFVFYFVNLLFLLKKDCFPAPKDSLIHALQMQIYPRTSVDLTIHKYKYQRR
jgi:hypothetical protein